MEAALLRLLERLERIGEAHPELYDSAVREALRDAMIDGFARLKPDYVAPSTFEMFTSEGDEKVRAAFEEFLAAAQVSASEQGLTTFHRRLADFQNNAVRTDEGSDFDEFFGTCDPDCFDPDGDTFRSE